MFVSGRIVTDQLYDAFQGHFGGTSVRIAFEKANGIVFHVFNKFVN